MTSFFVPGKPATKGSFRAFVVRGRVVVIHDNPRCKAWQKDVAKAAKVAMAGEQPHACTMAVRLVFTIEQPKKTIRTQPQGDIDKLTRAVFDAMTGVVYGDDDQVIRVEARKVWGSTPGVHVDVAPYTERGPTP